MQMNRHVTRIASGLHGGGAGAARFRVLVTMAAIAVGTRALVADDIEEMLGSGKATTAPAAVSGPDAPENRPTSDALGTIKRKAPAGARIGSITLSDGTTLEGRIWTTLETPLRVWVEENNTYHDIDLSLIKKIEVHVIAATMEDDWRWLKEGSDQKVFSGKKYPSVQLAYKFTLANDQVMEGTVVAPIYFEDGAKGRTLALYKQFKGKLDETLKDVIYISAITMDVRAGDEAVNEGKTTKLPLLPD